MVNYGWFPNLLDNLLRNVDGTCALGVAKDDAGSSGDLAMSKVRKEEGGVRLGNEAPVRAQPTATATAGGKLQERRVVAGGRQMAGRCRCRRRW